MCKQEAESVDHLLLHREIAKKLWTTCFKAGVKDHHLFQAFYATVLGAHMTAPGKRERNYDRRAADADENQESPKKPPYAANASV
ncbi:hypothetical protein L1049_017292 [Liquidambar formosana]|uniref:Uncharacterized protein n=1 Tax=Liquidambar formosana TaxID=63359 RepID=A0AAP0S787_LIQFO